MAYAHSVCSDVQPYVISYQLYAIFRRTTNKVQIEDPEKKQMNANKVVLAYSGGLDTSVILRWLIEKYGCEVIAFCADLARRSSASNPTKSH